MAEVHRFRMIKDKTGTYHRVCMDCKQPAKTQIRNRKERKAERKERATSKVKFRKQYTNYTGRVFRQYERTDTGQRVDIIMRDSRDALWNYTQAEATAEAKRRLGA